MQSFKVSAVRATSALRAMIPVIMPISASEHASRNMETEKVSVSGMRSQKTS